jgi:hypothetical protein
MIGFEKTIAILGAAFGALAAEMRAKSDIPVSPTGNLVRAEHRPSRDGLMNIIYINGCTSPVDIFRDQQDFSCQIVSTAGGL